jgi:hypothetical protein
MGVNPIVPLTEKVTFGIPRCSGCGVVFPNSGALGGHARYSKTCTPEVRFWGNVDKSAGPDACWKWTAQKRWDGYGRFLVKGKPQWSHRFAYELHYGPIPEGMHVLHSCDHPECTNPRHLRLGTHDENMAEMHAKGRGNTKLTADDVREIRRLLPVETQKDIAARYGVTPSAISEIKTGKKWQHVQ